jgi:hypothetical protein
MKPSRLSREATGEPSLVETIRNGRSPKLATVEKLMKFMAATDAEARLRAKLNAPLDAPPPAPEEIELPFRPAPVNPTGASSPTSSPTNERRSQPEATSSAFGFADSAAPAAAPRANSSRRQQPVESWALPAEQVERWLKSARVGDQLVYARGPSLIGCAAAELVRRLAREGAVYPFPRRFDEQCSDYIVRLLRVRVVTQRTPVVDPNMLAVLVVIQDAAALGERCPSDAAIAAETGLSADQVKWQLKKLMAARMIEKRIVACTTDPKFRVVRVVATGAETRGPQ